MATIKCIVSGEEFEPSRLEQKLYKKFNLVSPDKSPVERWRLLLSFQNSHKYFWRKCSQTGEKVYSMYAPASPFKVVSVDTWLNRVEDALEYGQDYDEDQPFFAQLVGVWHQAPRPATSLRNIVLSLVDQYRGGDNSSYLVFDSSRVRSCLYSVSLRNCERCMDCYLLDSCNDCYESINCLESSSLFWSEHSVRCRDSYFLSNCENCTSCIFCTNLANAKFCIFNKFVGEEEFKRFVEQHRLDSVIHLEQAKSAFQDFIKDNPIPAIYAESCRDCSGNYLHNCKKVSNSYELRNCKEVVNSYGLSEAARVVDGLGFGEGLTDSALFVSVGINSSFVFQSIECWNNVHHLRYCSHCEDSSNLFGCVGLRGREYCILNKQYSIKEYFKRVEQIELSLKEREEWGKPLAPLFSGFAYNHSLANDLFPLSQAQATLMGYRWDERNDGIKPSQLLRLDENEQSPHFVDLPDSVSEEGLEQIQQDLFLCEMTGRPFRIVKEEARLLFSMRVAPPTRCFEQRHAERLKKLSVGRLFKRKDIDGKEVTTAFPASWKRAVVEQKKMNKIVKSNSKKV